MATKRKRPDPPEPAQMIVDQVQGKILGWQRGNQFIPLGQNCCESPLECTRCFGPVEEPWWARWRRR